MDVTAKRSNKLAYPSNRRTTVISSGPNRSRYIRQVLIILVVAAVYFGAAKLGLSFAFVHSSVSPIWPPAGIGIAAVLLFGKRVWPGIFLGALLANALTPVTLPAATGIALGNTLEAVLAGFVLRLWSFHVSLDHARDVFKFVITAVAVTVVGASVGTFTLCVFIAARWDQFGLLWTTWWLGDLAGVLTVAPLLLAWGIRSETWLKGWRYVETALLALLLSIVALVTFGQSAPTPVHYYPLTRLMIPFLLLAAFRLGHRGVTLAIALLSGFAVWGTSRGLGPFIAGSPNESLIILQLFIASNAVTFLFLASVIEERRLAEKARRVDERRLATNLAISRILAESPELNDATRRILKAIGDTLGWKTGSVWTVDADANALRCLTVWSAPGVNADKFETVTIQGSFAPGIGLPGRVWRDQSPCWIRDIAKDDNFPRAPFALAEGLHSAFAFPVVAGEKFLGVMEFFSDEIRRPDDALLAMIGSVGSQIGQYMERRRAEESLRAREAELEIITETTPVMLTRCNRDLQFEFINGAYAALLGREPKEVIGKPIVDVLGAEAFQTMRPYVERVLQGEPVEYEEEISYKGVAKRFVRVAYRPDFNDAGNTIGWVASITDITDRKQAEAERDALLKREHEARAQAEEANRLKDEFLATLSHELRTPLNAILGWASLLRGGKLDRNDLKRAIEIIERNAKVQSQLIEGVLDVSRIVSGKLQLDVRPLHLSAVIGAALDSIRPAAEAKNMKVRVITAGDEPLVSGDPNRLQQILWNLLSNAVKFSPPGGEITVHLQSPGSQVEVVVRDTGQGISREFLPHVFDRFRQADSTTTRKHGGLGLGLAIVRHLAELHGGSVRADSEGEGKGATFSVSLPAIKTEMLTRAHAQSSAATQESVDLRVALAGLKILVVDDHSDARELLTEMLLTCNAEVKAAMSVAEALRLVRDWQPEVVVSDISMPNVDGYTFIRELRALDHNGGIPAIAVTAHAHVEDRQRALLSGFQDHLSKPVELSQLALSIAQVTGRMDSEQKKSAE